MDRTDVILISGMVFSCVWLITYIIFKGKKKKNIVLIVGAALDIIFYFICKQSDFLLAGVIGGLIIGLIPGIGSIRKREIALNETGGVQNLTMVMVIFVTMIFMSAAIAYPDVKIVW
ncbi:MAG: hypothetical protein IJA10_05855 [Lachnospiraceae bacterium]|nr:hypothetical protein [Lachnospiraceae bacterium]